LFELCHSEKTANFNELLYFGLEDKM